MQGVRLLVSVRDEEEAEAALAGGADLIDVKEPALGSLGKADDAVIRAVVRRVSRRVPVSAALGEWDEGRRWPAEVALDFVKWGPAGARRASAAWRSFIGQELDRENKPAAVIVAYADEECAQAPPLGELVELACARPGRVLLIDTHCKNAGAVGFDRRPNLLDWLSREAIDSICRRCRNAGARVALAGSLGLAEIEKLRDLRPDWFAVRGAACAEGDRGARIEVEKVRMLVKALKQWT